MGRAQGRCGSGLWLGTCALSCPPLSPAVLCVKVRPPPPLSSPAGPPAVPPTPWQPPLHLAVSWMFFHFLQLWALVSLHLAVSWMFCHFLPVAGSCVCIPHSTFSPRKWGTPTGCTICCGGVQQHVSAHQTSGRCHTPLVWGSSSWRGYSGDVRARALHEGSVARSCCFCASVRLRGNCTSNLTTRSPRLPGIFEMGMPSWTVWIAVWLGGWMRTAGVISWCDSSKCCRPPPP